MVKSDISAVTVDWFEPTPFAAVACTMPPLKDSEFPEGVAAGVRTMVMVAVEADGKVGMVQTTLDADEPVPVQVPLFVALAEFGVTVTPVPLCWLLFRVSVTITFTAGSGPLLIRV